MCVNEFGWLAFILEDPENGIDNINEERGKI